MKADELSRDVIPNCNLCDEKMNLTLDSRNDIYLCSECFQHTQDSPQIVAKSVERFLIGNVV
jgi:hypothetical protein